MINDDIISYNLDEKCIIYCAINRLNGKIYIGKTRNSLKNRIKSHRRKSYQNPENNYFHNAISKHSIENFEWGILYIGNEGDNLFEHENRFILKYDTIDPNIGYNSRLNDHFETFLAESSKKIISDKAKIRMKDSKNNPFYGRTHTIQTKENWSKIRKGKTLGSNNSFFGRHHTDDSKKKISKSRKHWGSLDENIKLLKYRNQHRKLVLCVDLNILFDSIKDAYEYFKINASTFKSHIRKSEYCFNHRFVVFEDF